MKVVVRLEVRILWVCIFCYVEFKKKGGGGVVGYFYVLIKEM